MSKSTTMNVEIRFGDCDPAGIVFFPRYHRWMDASSLHFFMTCGVPPWHLLEHSTGIIGTPLLEHHARFVKSATYGERLTIHLENHLEHEKVFDATLSLRREPLTHRALARLLLLRFPLMSLRIAAAIYFEAMRLLLKRIPFYPHPQTASRRA